tara:strand:+ start:227 stop:358 length:132 start_codon:yes stop_codon:yes gene_type:complete
MSKVSNAVPVFSSTLSLVGEDYPVDSALEEVVCPVAQKIADID